MTLPTILKGGVDWLVIRVRRHEANLPVPHVQAFDGEHVFVGDLALEFSGN
jgi:hypothetical protein